MQVIDAVKELKLQRLLEYSGRKSYKISAATILNLPQQVSEGLGDLKKVSSTFGGKRGQKVKL